MTAIQLVLFYVLLNLTGTAGSVIFLLARGHNTQAKAFVTPTGFLFCAGFFWPMMIYFYLRKLSNG